MEKILFFDNDGTLGQQGVITDSNLKALHLLKEKGLDEHEVKAAIIGSVVPNIMHSLTSGLIKYFDVKPIIVGPGI